MPLVEAKCPNCGAPLRGDSSSKRWKCEHCGNEFFAEAAISFFNTVNHIHADTVNIYQQGETAEAPKADDRYVISDAEIYKNELSDLDRAMGKRCVRVTVRGTEKEAHGDMLVYHFPIDCLVTELVFEEGVVSITGHWGSDLLKYLQFPKSLMKVEAYAFHYCKSLEKVYAFPELLESAYYSNDAFIGTPFEGTMKSAKGRAEYEANQKRLAEERAQAAQREAWKAAGRCWMCGGRLKKDKYNNTYATCVKCGQRQYLN